MSFTTTVFLFAFLPFSLIGYYLLNHKLRNVFLLLVSLLFYTWGQPKLVVLLCGSIFINYIFALLIEKFSKKKIASRFLLILSLIFNVGLLFIFKYLATTLLGINKLFGTSFSVVSLTLPLGISFFTFKAISYVLDVYFQTSKAQSNIVNVALYISFFPQLTAGPISLYNDFEKQLNNRAFNITKLAEGIKRIIIGLSKKVILANSIAILVDNAFSMANNERTIFISWLGIIGYLLQLYYDFSGYSDMAIGLSKLFGFECPENFNYPYLTKSIGEYWRRWHITLGTWLKTYLYTPTFRAFMNKKNPITRKTFSIQQCDIIALFVTWVICGTWHGAGLTYFTYGMYYFIFIAAERLLQARKKKIAKIKKLPAHKETLFESAKAHIYSIIVIIFGQLIFRAPSLSAAFNYFKCMFGLNNNRFTDALTMYYFENSIIFIIIAIIFSFPIVKILKELLRKSCVLNKLSQIVEPLAYVILFIIGIAYAINSTYNAFIYFKF